MHTTNVYLEIGKKRTFACAVDWPGWSRSGRDESAALAALVAYNPRYAQVMRSAGFDFKLPEEVSSLSITDRLTGDATTDYGAPGCIPEFDREPLIAEAYDRSRRILQACWEHFDSAFGSAAGVPLRKGPRGGGRDLEAIARHVLEGDQGYLSRIAWKAEQTKGLQTDQAFELTRQAILAALDKAVHAGLPERGPRGGLIWPVRYFIRRAAWHVLDHAWEIEDRVHQASEV